MLRSIVQIMYILSFNLQTRYCLFMNLTIREMLLTQHVYVFFSSSGMPSRLNEVQSPVSDSDDEEIDGYKESKTQKYLISMIISYAVCLCPLMILR